MPETFPKNIAVPFGEAIGGAICSVLFEELLELDDVLFEELAEFGGALIITGFPRFGNSLLEELSELLFPPRQPAVKIAAHKRQIHRIKIIFFI